MDFFYILTVSSVCVCLYVCMCVCVCVRERERDRERETERERGRGVSGGCYLSDEASVSPLFPGYLLSPVSGRRPCSGTFC